MLPPLKAAFPEYATLLPGYNGLIERGVADMKESRNTLRSFRAAIPTIPELPRSAEKALAYFGNRRPQYFTSAYQLSLR